MACGLIVRSCMLGLLMSNGQLDTSVWRVHVSQCGEWTHTCGVLLDGSDSVLGL